jgi:hypothetical protein
MTIIYQIPDCSNYEFYHWFYYALATLHEIRDISGTVFFTVPMQNLEFQISSLKLLEHTFKCVNDINDLPDKDNIVYTKLHNIIAGHNNIPEQKEIYSFLRTNLLDKIQTKAEIKGAVVAAGTAAKIVGKETVESVAKKVLGKQIFKSFATKIPIVGLVAGLGFAASRFFSGDNAGAAMELGSAALGTIPVSKLSLKISNNGRIKASLHSFRI